LSFWESVNAVASRPTQFVDKGWGCSHRGSAAEGGAAACGVRRCVALAEGRRSRPGSKCGAASPEQAAIHGVNVWVGTIAANGGHDTAVDKGWRGVCSLGGRGFVGCSAGLDSATAAALVTAGVDALHISPPISTSEKTLQTTPTVKTLKPRSNGT
jgi:hypothetical protein